MDGVSAVPRKWEIPDVIATSECPRRGIPDDANVYLDLVGPYRNGVLWTRGGLSDQPQIYLEAVRLLIYWVDEFTK